MTETLQSETAQRSPGEAGSPRLRGGVLRAATALACLALGFALVVQLRATEDLADRLEIEREEDLAQILADLSTQSDQLQAEITDLRLRLLAFSNDAQSEDLALRSLRQRLDQLRVLSGTVPVAGPGVKLTITDPQGEVTQAEMVDAVQELRDAGAEALAVEGVRLVASSAFVTRDDHLAVDGTPMQSPYVIRAVGPASTMVEALGIPGGALDTLEALPRVTAVAEARSRITVPARPEPVPFLHARPVEEDGQPTAPGG